MHLSLSTSPLSVLCGVRDARITQRHFTFILCGHLERELTSVIAEEDIRIGSLPFDKTDKWDFDDRTVELHELSNSLLTDLGGKPTLRFLAMHRVQERLAILDKGE